MLQNLPLQGTTAPSGLFLSHALRWLTLLWEELTALNGKSVASGRDKGVQYLGQVCIEGALHKVCEPICHAPICTFSFSVKTLGSTNKQG